MKTNKITKIIILTMILGIISVSQIFAAGPAAVTARNIREKIVDLIYNGDLENLPSEGTVVVLFTVTDEGKIEIKNVKSTDNDAENFVVNKITSISAKDNVNPSHQVYRVKFQFDQN
jgi:hypothetical protein